MNRDDLDRLLRQADPDDAASLDALVAGLARAGHLGRRRGSRIVCQMGAIVWVPADSAWVLTGGMQAVLLSLPGFAQPLEIYIGGGDAERARQRLAAALQRLEPVIDWRELLADDDDP